MRKIVLSDNLKELRTEKGITQKAFAEALHVSDSAVSKWENGQNEPDAGMLLEIAGYYGISVEELLTGKQGDVSGGQEAVPDVDAGSRADDVLNAASGEKSERKRKWLAAALALVCAASFFTGIGAWIHALSNPASSSDFPYPYEIVAERYVEDPNYGEIYEMSVLCPGELSMDAVHEISDDIEYWWRRSEVYDEEVVAIKILINDNRRMAEEFRTDMQTYIIYTIIQEENFLQEEYY